jgi:hypothetical protein
MGLAWADLGALVGVGLMALGLAPLAPFAPLVALAQVVARSHLHHYHKDTTVSPAVWSTTQFHPKQAQAQ